MTRAVVQVELDVNRGLDRADIVAAEIRRLVNRSLGHLNPEVSVLDTGARS